MNEGKLVKFCIIHATERNYQTVEARGITIDPKHLTATINGGPRDGEIVWASSGATVYDCKDDMIPKSWKEVPAW